MSQDVGSDILLAMLDSAWTSAGTDANTLRNELVIQANVALKLTLKGSLASVSKNSSSQTYAKYGPGVLTHTQLVEAWQTLVRLYDLSLDRIQCAVTVQGVTMASGFDFDLPVYDMMRAIIAISDVDTRGDITNLNIPVTTPPQPATFGASW